MFWKANVKTARNKWEGMLKWFKKHVFAAGVLLFIIFFTVFIQKSFLNDYLENRDPEKLDMIAIEGTEISNIRHLGSHFNDYMGEVEPGYEGDKVD